MLLDHFDMLARYMDMVAKEEGTYFTSRWDGYFCPDEMAELQRIIDEVPI